jgi:hypothetical protein
MSGKLLVICHCECNEVERRNRKDFAITSLRYRYVPCNDKHLAGLDITRSRRVSTLRHAQCIAALNPLGISLPDIERSRNASSK